ncbi:MAG: threonine dehydratase [Steroidobacteraceae bacterium]
MLPTLSQIESTEQCVYSVLAHTPQYCWPLICERLGAEVWLKHENHTPVGAFKVRGGLVYFAELAKSSKAREVFAATRGNHGQSVALSAKRHGLSATIVVPCGNSVEKNNAMRALGATLIELGADFEEARQHATRLAQASGAHMVPSFHPLLVQGVATYAVELFRSVHDLESMYVPIGLGSGICGTIAVRNALSPKTKIIGVVSTNARAYSLSFVSRRAIESPVTTRLADGIACRTPHPDALEAIWNYVDRIVEVTDDEIATAMRTIYECTHNCAEGAGAAAIAALMKESDIVGGAKVAAVLSGGNVDRAIFSKVLSGAPLDA